MKVNNIERIKMKSYAIKSLLFVGICLLLVGNCTLSYARNYWPYSKLSPNKLQSQKLVEYNDCLIALDAILTDEVKKRFLEQDSVMAPIEICQEIGGFFITNWKLNRYGERKGTTAGGYTLKVPKQPENIPSRFIYDGIGHPQAMIRVIFACYYKFLKGQEYDWQSEIERLKSYWINPEIIYYYVRLPDKMIIREDSIINNYYYRQMEVNDSVVCLLRQPPKLFSKRPSWFYLTGIIQSKNEECKQINIKIVNIETEFDKTSVELESDTISVGDIIPGIPIDWHKVNLKYFDYHSNRYYPSFNNPMKE